MNISHIHIRARYYAYYAHCQSVAVYYWIQEHAIAFARKHE